MTVTLSKNVIADDGYVIAEYAKQYGISTIFLDVAGDDVGLLAAQDPQESANLNAMLAVASVYVVTGNASWLTTPASVPSDVTTIVRTIAPAFPKLAGILYDVAPTSSQTAAYFQLLDTLLGGSRPYAFGKTLLQTSPQWQRWPNRTGGKTPSMLEQAESYSAVNGTYLQMNGGSASLQMTNDVDKALPQLAKPYWSGANAYSSNGNSYLGQTASYVTSNMQQVASDVSAIDPNLSGISVGAWQDRYGSLQTIFAQPFPAPIPAPSAPLLPPAGKLYLGAYVDPTSGPGYGGGAAGVAAFESAIGRKLAYDLHFSGWTSAFPPSLLKDDGTNGRVPLVALDCGDSDARVASGADDSTIEAQAAAAAAFGHPIFLRFFWEFNLPASTKRGVCYDAATDLPNGKFSPANFKAAWRHMHDLYLAAGAKNVIWVWNESGGGPTPAEYYPGNDVVDWVGVDYYDRINIPFVTNESPYLNDVAQYEKPIMICETAATAAYQAQYFPQIVATLPSDYGLVKALSFFDAEGTTTGGDWSLTSAGISGFSNMGQQPAYSAFAPTP
jgi:endoglucanase